MPHHRQIRNKTDAAPDDAPITMILVLGAGAVGTVLATYLAAAGRDVAVYAREKDRLAFAECPAMQVQDTRGKLARSAPLPRLLSEADLCAGDVLLLCVKATSLDVAMATAGALGSGCSVVSTLNGVAPLRRLRAHWPSHEVAPLSILWNCQLQAPLQARLTTRPEMYLGSSQTHLARLFDGIGIPCKLAEGDAAVWGKLMINLANAICALTQTTFRDLFTLPSLRRCYVATLDEATRALDAAQTHWELPLAVPYRVYRWMLLRGGPLPWWVAHLRNGVGEGAYPSMVADLRAGKATEVRELNGEIVALGEAHGIPTPVNQALVRLVTAAGAKPPMSPMQLVSALAL